MYVFNLTRIVADKMGKLDAEASNVDQHVWGLNEDRLGHTLNKVTYYDVTPPIWLDMTGWLYLLYIWHTESMIGNDNISELEITEFFQFHWEFLLRNLMRLMLEGTIRFTIYLKAKI